jgi:hypothetical protein
MKSQPTHTQPRKSRAFSIRRNVKFTVSPCIAVIAGEAQKAASQDVLFTLWTGIGHAPEGEAYGRSIAD